MANESTDSDSTVDIEKIMDQIKQRATSKDMTVPDLNSVDTSSHSKIVNWSEVYHNLRKAKSYQYINTVSLINSKRSKILQPFIIRIKRRLNRQIRIVVNPIVDKQIAFNGHIVKTINELAKGLEELYMNGTTDIVKIEGKQIAVATANEGRDRRSRDESHVSLTDMQYLEFQDRFRGSYETIRKNMERYIEYFASCKQVLDIGCGRGEFLELLREKGIDGKGVDSNVAMIQECKRKGLKVELADALLYLESIADSSLDGIFCGQMIEHFDAADQIKLIKLCYSKLNDNGIFIAETINPNSLPALTHSYYLDLTHGRPMHPFTFEFLAEITGFKENNIIYLSPFDGEAEFAQVPLKVGLLKGKDPSADQINTIITIMNRNIARLNKMLNQYQDYAIIARK